MNELRDAFQTFGHHTSQPEGQEAPRARPRTDKAAFTAVPPEPLQNAAPDLPCASWSRDRNNPGAGLVQSQGCPRPLRALLLWGRGFFQGRARDIPCP